MKIWGLGQISPEERNDILSKHKEIYDGYRTFYPETPNTQPLYVQDFANDKVGLVVNNKGNVKRYTNVGINESTHEQMCSECGSVMMEGECSECGWKGEVGEMDDEDDDNEEKIRYHMSHPMSISKDSEDSEKENEDDIDYELELKKEKFRRGVDLGSAFGKFKKMQESTGKLDDIYDVEDLGNAEFDYVEGGGNKYGTFKKNHLKMEEFFQDDDSDYEEFEFEIDEQGMTGGGSSPDTNISNIKSAYDFISNGPMAGGDVYPTESELDENDISGVQGIYGDMEPAYDFDSEGPGKAGPYQRSSWNETETKEQYLPSHIWKKHKRKMDAEKSGEDFDFNELDITDYEDDDIKNKSWEEITAMTGDDEFSYLDEDLKESFNKQKNKISEMFVRMKVIK